MPTHQQLPPPHTHTHTHTHTQCIHFPAVSTAWSQLSGIQFCFSWPGLPRPQGQGLWEGEQPQGPWKQGSRCKNPLEIIAAMPLHPDNTQPFAIVLYLKSLPSGEKFIDLPLSTPLRPYPTVKRFLNQTEILRTETQTECGCPGMCMVYGACVWRYGWGWEPRQSGKEIICLRVCVGGGG